MQAFDLSLIMNFVKCTEHFSNVSHPAAHWERSCEGCHYLVSFSLLVLLPQFLPTSRRDAVETHILLFPQTITLVVKFTELEKMGPRGESLSFEK